MLVRHWAARGIGFAGVCSLGLALPCLAQNVPLAIVPVDGVKLTGGLEIAEGKAVIAASGSITAGERAATVQLPHRGNLLLCPTTTVNLTRDSSVAPAAAAGEMDAAGLMMALGHGALEANFATGQNSDVILTPDFRILISGPGTAAVRVRLGTKGDTCVENRGPNAPYVSVSSLFEGGVYRVQADQRVMFQHGSLREVVDRETESCGCPPETPKSAEDNAFPVAQSEGLAPLTPPTSNVGPPGTTMAQATVQLSYDGKKVAEARAAEPPVAPAPEAAVAPPAPKPKQGFFGSIGHFFRKLFGG